MVQTPPARNVDFSLLTPSKHEEINIVFIVYFRMEISEAAAEDHDISITHAQPIEVPDDDEPVITNVIVSKYFVRF